mmetsp:Transcript_9094/g.24515  ORF Transcript_9094/g.24515 Transcript_9094/m.24515 type:complete len:122 (+) Transcript_9094:955-1320(+)
MQVPRKPDGCAHIVVKRQSKQCLLHRHFVICFSRVSSLNTSPYTTQSVPQIINEMLQENRCTLLRRCNKRITAPQSLKAIQDLAVQHEPMGQSSTAVQAVQHEPLSANASLPSEFPSVPHN